MQRDSRELKERLRRALAAHLQLHLLPRELRLLAQEWREHQPKLWRRLELQHEHALGDPAQLGR